MYKAGFCFLFLPFKSFLCNILLKINLQYYIKSLSSCLREIGKEQTVSGVSHENIIRIAYVNIVAAI